MLSKKIIYSWIAGSILMFGLSYLWHGVVLNDFDKISYSPKIFLSFLSLLYIIIGGLLAFCYSLVADKKHVFLRGILLGVAAGFIIFLIIFVLGSSFKVGQINSLHATLDLIWQLIEQGAAGMAIAYVYHYIEQREILFN
ncbi:MAG: hypothetical protein H0V01_08755 [Bacteroidetes bacterium]|nr:hypothetical protein [Bacteroidota bacterium]HET6244579.1 hypothetical protein [Bacteroidia bacterium]